MLIITAAKARPLSDLQFVDYCQQSVVFFQHISLDRISRDFNYSTFAAKNGQTEMFHKLLICEEKTNAHNCRMNDIQWKLFN